MHRAKICLFIVLISVLISIVLIDVFGMSLSLDSVSKIKKTRKEKIDLITSLKINGISTIYDKNDNAFYYNISPKYEGNKYILKLNLNGFKYKLLDYKFNIIKVDYSKEIRVLIYNDKYYYETKIVITNLPIINITTDSEIAEKDTNARLQFINASSKIKEVNNNVITHVRGSSSTVFDKKSYRIRFYDETYSKKVNIAIQGFYSDDSFILNSVYRDPSKIRDNLATELWNDISNDFKDEDINSKYVELFINGEYKGLYIFSEPVNRKKLNLNKNTSIVIKSTGWDPIKQPEDIKKLNTDSYMGYEIKYPDEESLYNEVWKSFLNRVSDYYDSEKENSYKLIKETFNIKNYIDMVIFNSFTINMDSKMIKNLYFYQKEYNGLVYMEPWDLEFTFGYKFSTNKNAVNYGLLIDDANEIKIEMFDNDKKLNNMIVKRYWKLRESILTEEYFDNKIDKYLKDLKYASKRDSNIWYDYDLTNEVERVRAWIKVRIEVMDKYVSDYEDGV